MCFNRKLVYQWDETVAPFKANHFLFYFEDKQIQKQSEKT